ncbi:hypothetical protein HMPREF0542_11791 [Ligilactobacillus ruminis ATCC 25644]|uniref:Uncharacterized protein n=1 Tax=Ligilactobacillus ruminis ATCC 25644 TaxID=525362 RepID=E7FSB4_9LACO|nr:hypothetical protein HMPREF0542_11791 [Ligilactobacillus ruminis ATCC 25644]
MTFLTNAALSQSVLHSLGTGKTAIFDNQVKGILLRHVFIDSS